MARDFTPASSQYLVYAGAPVSVAPLTLAVLFYPDSVAINQQPFSIGHSTNDDGWAIAVTNSAVAQVRCRAGGSNASASGGTVTASAWHSLVGVFASTTSRNIYLDGAAGTENTTSKAPGTPDQTIIGASGFGAVSSFIDGRQAYAAAWSVALAQGDIDMLAKFISPLLVRPDKLEEFWPIGGRTSPEIGIVGGLGATVMNAPPYIENPRAINIRS